MRTLFASFPRGPAITLLAALTPASVAGQTLALTEADALARLEADSPRVRALRAPVDFARADELEAARWPNPTVTWNREAVAGVAEHMVMVAQPLPITGRRGFEIDAAAARVAATSARADDQERRLRADLRQAFAALWLAQTRERELARATEEIQALAEALARREAAGDAAGYDRLRAEHEAFELDAERALVAADVSRAQAALVALFGSPVDPSTVVAVRADPASPLVPALGELLARAETSRGELLAFGHDAEAARLAARAAVRARIPEPEVVGGTKSSTLLGEGELGSVLAVHVTIPLFDRARPERARAEAATRQAEARANALRIALEAELAGLRTAVLKRRTSAIRHRTGAADLAGEMARIAQVSYDAGERNILELLDAYQAAAEARIRQAELDAAAWQAEIELEYASGWEMPS